MENITINGNVTVNISTAGANTTAAIPETKESFNITENTTLGELLKLLDLGEKPHEIPTPKKLRENAGKPIAFYPMSGSVPVQNVECTVYSNGFAVYDNGSGRTVLWLPDCTSFTCSTENGIKRKMIRRYIISLLRCGQQNKKYLTPVRD